MMFPVSSPRILAGLGILGVSLGAFGLAVTTAVADPNRTVASVKPLAGLTLDAGSKHAVGYFEAADGGCNLTLLVADAVNDVNPVVHSAPARIATAISAGRTVRVDTVDGPSIELACAADASSLEARVVQRLAYAPAAK
ncbi:MAG: hypothetical protein NW216_14540 [Hyphomicrobium sp.]|nr:hypothetical protein [Hyphomicrobium sp.]